MRIALILCALIPGSITAQPFTEEAFSRGVFYLTLAGSGYGRGLLANDLDGDGDIDLLALGRFDGQVGLFWNDGSGQFTDATGTVGIAPSYEYSGVSAADYDNDGDLDLYLTCWNESNRLYRNEGGFFSDVTLPAGVGDDTESEASAWLDYDGNGLLDLYLANYSTPNRLYFNLGGGQFVDVAVEKGVDDPHDTLAVIAVDYNLDSQPDLFVLNDRGNGVGTRHNRLFRNIGTAFEDVSTYTGADLAMDSMGGTVADLNGDLFPDLFITNDAIGNRLLLSTGQHTFEEVAEAAGVANVGNNAWGCHFFDFDSDGLVDLFVNDQQGPNKLYRNVGTISFVDVTDTYDVAGPDSYPGSYCSTYGDLDSDGDLDLVVQSGNEPLAIYFNQTAPTNHWLKVKLDNGPENRFAVGARIEVTSELGQQVRYVTAGSGFKSSIPYVQHFGLRSDSSYDQIVVHWPDGEVTLVGPGSANQTLFIARPTLGSFTDCNRNQIDDAVEISGSTDVDANGLLDVCQPFRRGDADGDAAVTLADAFQTLEVVALGANHSCPGALDINNDSLLDLADAVSLLEYLFLDGPPPRVPFPSCGVPTYPGNFSCFSTCAD